MIGHYDFRHSQPGHGYRLVQNAEGEIESFRYRISPIIGYELSLGADGSYTVVRDEAELWPRQTMIAGSSPPVSTVQSRIWAPDHNSRATLPTSLPTTSISRA